MEQCDQRAPVLSLAQAPNAIELRHLRAFAVVATELHFGRAADRLHLSQPAISRQINRLESLVGCPLLRRSTHHVELTLAGVAMLESTQSLLRDLDDAVIRTRSVAGDLSSRAESMWTPVATRTSRPGAGVHDLRVAYEAFIAQMPTPADLVTRPVTAGGVPGLQVSTTARAADDPTVLFLHGGGYVMGSAYGYRPLAGAVAAAADGAALVPDYRLAPECPYPAALDDALAAYEWMLDRVDASEIAVVGDSAGAGLALSLLLALGQRGRPVPGCAVLLCPRVGLGSPTRVAPRDVAAQDLTPQEQILQFSTAYLPECPDGDPVAHPLHADLSGLPPLLVQIGSGDALVPEAEALVAHARAHGVDVDHEVYAVSTHVFHFFWSFLPDAADALDRVGSFVHSHAARTGGTAVAPTGV